MLGSAILADAASFLALCCSGRVTSAWQRAVQVTGIASACLGLVTGVYFIWWGITVHPVGVTVTSRCWALAGPAHRMRAAGRRPLRRCR